MKKENVNKWYAKQAGNGSQGLVIEEETGRTVAVAYDPKDAALLAAASEMLEMLEEVEEEITFMAHRGDSITPLSFRKRLRSIIEKGKGG